MCLYWKKSLKILLFRTSRQISIKLNTNHPWIKGIEVCTNIKGQVLFKGVSLFVCFEPHEHLFSYLAAVTIAGDRAENLDLCLALTAFSSEVLYVPHLLRHETSVFKVISERPMILTSECRDRGKGAITNYFKRLKFDAAGPSGARTHDLPDAKRDHYH
jgi:hypothetical protein